jgi:diguanylate cyclase (GGDEF)-like protein/PAS domain S-box-containing protein
MLERTGEMAKVGGWELDLRSGKFIFSRQALLIDDIDDIDVDAEPAQAAGHLPKIEEGFALYAPKERQLIEAAVALAKQDGTPWDLELAKRTSKGRAIWVRTQGSAVIGANGRVIKLCGAYRDITERKLAEAELRIAATAFESQEAILVADADWRIMRVNQAFTRMTGYSAEEALGQLPAELIGSGREQPGFYAAMDQAVAKHGAWQGEVWDRRKNGEVFPVGLSISAVKGPDGELTHFVSGMTDITLRKASEEQIQSLAYYDPLTQLPNRRLLLNRLEKALAAALRYLHKGALLFVDLDNFKTLNDTLGHEQGDLLLKQVAQRLSHCVREGDTVARLGGDEFVVMLENLSEDSLVAATQAEAVGEKVLAALNQSYPLDSYEQHSTPSIGITLFGEQPEGIAEPLKRADLAMYQAKAAGKNMLRFFDPQMQAVVTARAALEVGLRDGLARGQFLLHYQAQVSGQGLITGAEALLRWPRPPFGLVPPGDFIPLAEDTGLILPLGLWVLETACHQLADWSGRSELAHLTLAVNVSARQVHQVDFVNQVLSVLARSGANPQRLKLELTEGVLVANVEEVIQKMTALKSAGVGFSLDDFGTGYSSLSYLKRLPLDQLKIDQGFVRDILLDPNDAAIARMVIVLAESLGLAVIAEGVETEAQRVFLAAQGCHAYQGYLFSRPLPLAGFEALVLNS